MEMVCGKHDLILDSRENWFAESTTLHYIAAKIGLRMAETNNKAHKEVLN